MWLLPIIYFEHPAHRYPRRPFIPEVWMRVYNRNPVSWALTVATRILPVTDEDFSPHLPTRWRIES